jgi:hypothetical protein
MRFNAYNGKRCQGGRKQKAIDHPCARKDC